MKGDKEEERSRKEAALVENEVDEGRGRMAQPWSIVFDLSMAGLCVCVDTSTRCQRYA